MIDHLLGLVSVIFGISECLVRLLNLAMMVFSTSPMVVTVSLSPIASSTHIGRLPSLVILTITAPKT